MADDKGDVTYLRTAFLERLAHELRGPAGVIHGALQELEAALGPSAGEHEVFLGMAKRGLKRILRTADRLQHTGQLERGTLEPSPVGCDLGALLKQAVSDAQFIREALECTAVRVAAELAGEESMAQLEENLRAQERAKEERSGKRRE